MSFIITSNAVLYWFYMTYIWKPRKAISLDSALPHSAFPQPAGCEMRDAELWKPREGQFLWWPRRAIAERLWAETSGCPMSGNGQHWAATSGNGRQWMVMSGNGRATGGNGRQRAAMGGNKRYWAAMSGTERPWAVSNHKRQWKVRIWRISRN